MSNNEKMSGAEVIANMADELSKARSILLSMCDEDGVIHQISELRELVSDIDAVLVRYDDYADSIMASTEGIEIK